MNLLVVNVQLKFRKYWFLYLTLFLTFVNTEVKEKGQEEQAFTLPGLVVALVVRCQHLVAWLYR